NTVSASLDVLVALAKRPPTLTVPGPRTLREGDTTVIYFPASSPDGSPVTFSSTALPQGAVLDPNSGRFEWTPAYNQHGQYQVPITAPSDGLSVTRTVSFTVLNVNAAPAFAPISSWSIPEGQDLTIHTFAFDPDNPEFVLPTRNPDGTLNPPGVTSPVTY